MITDCFGSEKSTFDEEMKKWVASLNSANCAQDIKDLLAKAISIIEKIKTREIKLADLVELFQILLKVKEDCVPKSAPINITLALLGNEEILGTDIIKCIKDAASMVVDLVKLVDLIINNGTMSDILN